MMLEKVEEKTEIRAELRGIYAVWLREIKRYLRDRTRILSAIFTPLIWLLLFGVGFSGLFQQAGFNFIFFVFPGIVGQSILFTSMFLGISVIYDKQFGFLKEMLVAPIRRISVFSGKLFGGATDAMIQGTIVLCLSFVLGIGIGPLVFLACLPVMFLTAITILGLSLTIASRLQSMESFGLVMTFIVMPLFFSSGALFPLTTAPGWLQTLSHFNPLTYAVDALRGLILGNTLITYNPTTFWYDLIKTLLFGNSIYPIWLDIAVLSGFAVGLILLGAFSFGMRK
ncbi:MAG: ABC transporter permease [Candidatus Jordarchaeum sp.]|uniref:ABC transporter permease n=1 Tax=Candidatus Jordarchaeum sp. TaxID=2823881 RepID=UPI00404B15F7